MGLMVLVEAEVEKAIAHHTITLGTGTKFRIGQEMAALMSRGLSPRALPAGTPVGMNSFCRISCVLWLFGSPRLSNTRPWSHVGSYSNASLIVIGLECLSRAVVS